jgi:hypothetical protein
MSDRLDIFRGYGIEITLDHPESFLKVKETLTRIGIASKKDNTLYQSCHILHKKGRYVICHFKELFALDGKSTDISENDIARRNTIAKLLQDWNLVKIIDEDIESLPNVALSQVKILSYKEKANWILSSKYSIGVKK